MVIACTRLTQLLVLAEPTLLAGVCILSKMGFDCGFDIYPTPSNQEKYASFISEVLNTYETEDDWGGDSVVRVVPDLPVSDIEFLVGEHPAIPYKCEHFLRFSSKASG